MNDFLKMNNDEILKENRGKKYDIVLMNPPYDRDLHLDFFDKGLELLSENGKCVIIEPASWLINVKDSGKAKIYKELKDKIEGIVESVEINAMNKIFGTGLYVPFSITTINKAKDKNEEIDFEISTERNRVKSIYDCNKIGKYSLVKSILKKCQDYGDMMKNHTTTKDVGGDDTRYVRYMNIITANGYDSKPDKIETKFGTFYGTFITPCMHKHDNKLYDHIPKTAVGNPAPCVYGSAQQLENWKWFVLNNKLPLFLNMVLTFDQHNNSEKYVPWLVDKQRSDEEIYKLLDINEEEQELIDKTIKKFEWHSDWYKKMCEEQID